jgi:SET domain-containing protein
MIPGSVARLNVPSHFQSHRMSDSMKVRKVRGMGRGVFAARPFETGEIIEVCPVIPLTPAEANDCGTTILDDYFFEWGPRRRAYALALGLGSLFNHSNDPNASFHCRVRKLQLVFRARRPIAPGEQITIDYGWPDMTKMPPPRVK